MKVVEGRPAYRIPYHHLLQGAYFMMKDSPRNLGADFRFLICHLPEAPIVEGVENLPLSGATVIVGNHYQRPGLWMGWAAMIAGRTVYEHSKRSVRWVAVSEWEDYRLLGFVIPSTITRAIFSRFQKTFNFIPMAPANASTAERATAVRTALQAVRTGDVIGIFPEGDIGPTPSLIPARPGTGLFLAALARQDAKLVPMGIFELHRGLHVVFGPSIDLTGIRSGAKRVQDEQARVVAMKAIARLLPEALRGPYAAL